MAAGWAATLTGKTHDLGLSRCGTTRGAAWERGAGVTGLT